MRAAFGVLAPPAPDDLLGMRAVRKLVHRDLREIEPARAVGISIESHQQWRVGELEWREADRSVGQHDSWRRVVPRLAESIDGLEE